MEKRGYGQKILNTTIDNNSHSISPFRPYSLNYLVESVSYILAQRDKSYLFSFQFIKGIFYEPIDIVCRMGITASQPEVCRHA